MNRAKKILVIVDTLRKDYADKYIWPVLEQFDFRSYEYAVSPSPWTTPAHASIFSGKYPSEHGIHETTKKKIFDVRVHKELPLTRILRNRGLKTALISANILVSKYFGFRKFTFEKNVDISSQAALAKKSVFENPRGWKKMGELALQKGCLVKVIKNYILRRLYNWPRNKNGSLAMKIARNMICNKEVDVCIINIMEVHEPYKGCKNATIRELLGTGETLRWEKEYKTQVKITSTIIKAFLEDIEQELPTLEIVITSDHGQLLGEDGRYGHGTYLDKELVRVPLYYKNVALGTSNGRWLSTKNLFFWLIGGIPKTEHYARSEAFGIHIKYDYRVLSVEERRTAKNLEKPRYRIFSS